MPKQPATPDPIPFSETVDGRLIEGFYRIDKGTLTISTLDHGTRSARVGDLPELTLVRMLLREMIRPS